MRGSTLQKEGTACAKGLSWAGKEVDKLQDLGGGWCDCRAISKRDTGWDHRGDASGARLQDGGARGRGLNSLLRGRRPTEGFQQGRGNSLQKNWEKCSNYTTQPHFWPLPSVEACPELSRTMTSEDCKASTMLLTKADMVEGSNLRRLPSDTARGPRVPPYHSLSTPIREALAGIWGFSHCTSKGHPACLCLSCLDDHGKRGR